MITLRIDGYAIISAYLSPTRDPTAHELSISGGRGGWINVTCRKPGTSRVLHAWTYSTAQRRWESDRAPTQDRQLLAAIMQGVEEIAADAVAHH